MTCKKIIDKIRRYYGKTIIESTGNNGYRCIFIRERKGIRHVDTIELDRFVGAEYLTPRYPISFYRWRDDSSWVYDNLIFYEKHREKIYKPINK